MTSSATRLAIEGGAPVRTAVLPYARQVLDDVRARHHGMNPPNAIIGNPDQVAARLKQYWDVGVKGFIVGFAYPYDTTTIERLAKEVRPRLKKLIAA